MENSTDKTFTMSVSYVAQMPVVGGGFEDQMVTKTATFKELDRRSREQHKLHSLLISVCNSFRLKGTPGDQTLQIDSDGIYDVTERAVKTLLVTNTEFTEQDKTEFLSDGPSLVNFGYELMEKKLFPFFSSSREITKAQ